MNGTDPGTRPKLPKRRPVSEIRLPRRRTEPILPQLERKRLRCPYCAAPVSWPPEGLRCPACGKVLRPPPGFAPKDMALRREAKEKIAKARDKALRELGPRAGGERASRAGWLVAALFMLFLGAALVGASRRAAPGTAPGRDNTAWTTNVIAIAAMALKHYSIDTGHYPTLREGGLAALGVNPGASGWNGPYLSGLGNDGWNRPFAYIPAAGDLEIPDFRSAGEDRIYNTPDDLVAEAGMFRVHPDFIPAASAEGAGAGDAPVSVVIDPNWL
ncbi:MAG: type II secretion system protein GspG [Kiritimatiellae bacterium]|nr:type II secretion system protein GspG [Kiritimatiellia bacterium]